MNDDGRPHADHTFRSWADEWLTKRLRRPGKNTIRDYRSTVGIANSVFGDKQLRKLSSRDILDLLDKLDGRANNTQRKHLRNLNGAFESAVRAGLIRRNPIASLGDAELPRAVKVPPAYFTDVELVRLYAALERKQDGVRLYDDVYPVLVRAAVMTGLRKGELVELRWRDVDLVDGSLYVLRSWNDQTREVTTPKSGHGRTVDMIPPAIDLLARWKTDSDQPDDLVFPNPLGGRLVAKTINRVLYKAMAAATDEDKPAPIPREGEHGRGRDFHSLRHTFARKMLTGGAAIDWVKGQLGHSTITLTVDTYGAWDRAGKKAEAAKLADAFA